MASIQILSDLHVEFAPFTPVRTQADVVVLAGDIHVKGRTVQWAKEQFPDQPVVLVLGNHDYWGGNLGKTLDKAIAAAQGSNVHVLENSSVTIAGIRFIGASLWTDYRSTGNQPLAMLDAQQRMTDFKKIRDARYRKVHPRQLVEMHTRSRAYLEEAMAQPHDGPTVVVTHHAPCELSIPPHHRQQTSNHLSASYASKLDHLMGPPTSLWVHGHTHASSDYEIAGTRVICNPRGYAPDELNPGFDPGLVLSIPCSTTLGV